MSEITDESLSDHINYFATHDPTAIEAYFLKQNISPKTLIPFMASILDDPDHPLFAQTVWMMIELPDIQGLSASDSTGWKEDAHTECRRAKILEKLVKHLHHPDSKVQRDLLEALLTFLKTAVWEEGGFKYFDIGWEEIDQIKAIEMDLLKLRESNDSSPELIAILNRMFLFLKESDSIERKHKEGPCCGHEH